MNRKLLFKFFEGKTSFEEEKRIRSWMEKSESNSESFMKNRAEYDIQLLAGHNSVDKKSKKDNITVLKFVSSVAAVALLLIVSGIYIFNYINSEPQFNTVIVPAGQRINLILSDNTNLWLNSNSTLRYPTEFSKNNRTVYLDGEAYFEVSKTKEKPFIVKTPKGDIYVTGTSFNVEAYSKFNNFETSLFKGGVDIFSNEQKLVSLKPNEKVSIKNNEILVEAIEDTGKYLWKDGLIVFNDKSLEEIIHSLERYFDVEIKIDSSTLPQLTYTGKFRQEDGVDYALRVLQKSINFIYERNEVSRVIEIK